jgi:hypothetical protein
MDISNYTWVVLGFIYVMCVKVSRTRFTITTLDLGVQ